jgi:hypothetical protein
MVRHMELLQQRARAAIKKHGGLRAASRAIGINPSTLLYLSDGRRQNATLKTMRKLGVDMVGRRGV